MCLISVLGKGTKKYSEEVTAFITAGFQTNRDGSGFMYKKNGENHVYVDKGYWAVNLMLAAIKDADLKDDDELVIHHRTGTAGLKTPENTHPFVLSHKHEEIIVLKGKTDKPCVVHNGMFRNTDDLEKRNPDFSDTYAFTRYVLTNTIGWFISDREVFLDQFKTALGWSRLCFLFPDKDLIMSGDFIEDNGYFHSNAGYKNWEHRDRGGISDNVRTQNFLNAGGIKASGSNQLSLPMAVGKKHKQPVVLDGMLIDINEFNCHHFVYTPKGITGDKTFIIDSMDENDTAVTLTSSNNNHSHTMVRSLDALQSGWNFHPKFQYDGYYVEYINLLAKLQCSKNVLKDMFRILINNKPTNLPNIFKVKKINITKFTMVNYFLSNVKQFMKDDSSYTSFTATQLLTNSEIKQTVTVENKPDSEELIVDAVALNENVSCEC